MRTPALLPQHEHLIVASGIAPDVASARGYRSITDTQDAVTLGFTPEQARVPALLVPVWGVTGEIVTHQLRPDNPRVIKGKPIKYETPRGSHMALDVPPATLPHLGNPSVPLIVTEGVRKDDSAVSKGAYCIALLGVWNWRGSNDAGGKTALPDWESIALNGRTIYLCFDSDVTTKPAVAQALVRLRQFLQSRGASAQTLYLPPTADGGKQGLDDYLAVGHTITELLALTTRHDQEPGGARTQPSGTFTFTSLDDLLAEPQEDIDYVWDRTLPTGGTGMIVAKPKVGKSTFARALSVAVASGTPFFGRSTSAGSVIYLCLEEKRAEIAKHFRRMGAKGLPIFIHTGSTPEDALAALTAAIKEHQPVLVIIDPMSRFVRVSDGNAYAETARAMEPVIDLARASRAHLLFVHHAGKGERIGGDAVLGSTAYFGAVDCLLVMKRREAGRTIETFQRYGEDLPETIVHLDTNTGTVAPGGDMAAFLLSQAEAEVLAAIDKPLMEPDIKERVGGNTALTQRAIRALVETGALVKSGDGKKGNPYRYAHFCEWPTQFCAWPDPAAAEIWRNEHTGNESKGNEAIADSHLLISPYTGNEQMSKWESDTSTRNEGDALLIDQPLGDKAHRFFDAEAAG